MKHSRLLSLAMTLMGSTAAVRVLVRRHTWEQLHRQVAICVDYDDAQAAAIRAGLPFTEMLSRMAQSGATHVSLPELTLNRLLNLGQLTPLAPAQPLSGTPCVGHWNYLHGPSSLITYLAEELNTRLPYTEAQCLGETTLAFGGNLPTIAQIGLGFDEQTAGQISRSGLGIVPRPVSYDWPEPALLERTLVQAGRHGPLIAFAGNMIIGHEMHLDETLKAMTEQQLSLVYFAESRHQKGDWFIAKRRAPYVVLAHHLSPEEMIPLDYHAAVHNWVNLVRERGIRLCYINFFRVLHATAPLEGLHYIHHLKHALEDAGYTVSSQLSASKPIPTPSAGDLALTGLASAGVAAASATGILNLPEPVAIPLTVLAAGGAAVVPFVEHSYRQLANRQEVGNHHEHDHNGTADLAHSHEHHDHHHDHEHHDHHHDHDHPDLHTLYPPSYAPKLLGLAAAALAPIAASAAMDADGKAGAYNLETWAESILYPAAAAMTLAAVTSGQEYQLRIESYKGFNLDWFLPLAMAARRLPQRGLQLAALATLVAAWLALRRADIDPLDQVDPAHAQGHTHHISAAMRLVGDAFILLGPQPARKWSGLGPLATGLSFALKGRGIDAGAATASLVSNLGYSLGLVGFRQPQRALQDTLQEAIPSFALGAALGLLVQVRLPAEKT